MFSKPILHFWFVRQPSKTGEGYTIQLYLICDFYLHKYLAKHVYLCRLVYKINISVTFDDLLMK